VEKNKCRYMSDERNSIFADEPEVELDAEDDELSDIPTQSEVEESLEELKED